MVSLLRSTPNLKSIIIYEGFDPIVEQYLPKLVDMKNFHFSNERFEELANLYN
jgi:hypothetical protein